MPLMFRAPVPELVMVAVCGLPDCPTVMAGQVRVAGETEALAVPPPVEPPSPRPVSATCWGLFPASSLKLRVAVRVPEAVGLKRTVTVQLADAARVEPQVFW